MEPTGTAWDEFLPIYAALSIPNRWRRGYASHEVDEWEIPVVGTMLRLGARPVTIADEAADMIRRRLEADRLGLPPPEW